MQVRVNVFSLLLIIMLLACISPVISLEKAPDFTLFDINGEEISLSHYRGRVVLIDLFRMKKYCPACIYEIPHLKGVYDKYSRDEVIIMSISVSSLDTDDTLRSDFVEEYGIPWIVACGTNEIAYEYDVHFIPTLVIVDAEGNMRYRHEQVTDESTLSSEIYSLLSGTTNGDSDTGQPEPPPADSGTGHNGPPYTLIAFIGVGVVVFLVIGIVVAGQLLGWSESPKKRRPRERPRKRPRKRRR